MARLELRAAEADLIAWKHAADQRGQTVSDFIRTSANVMAAPSAFRVLLQRVREKILHYERQGGTSASGAIHLTSDEEHMLLAAGPGDLGGDRMGKLVIEGAKSTFPTLFGYPVRFRSHQFMIAPA